MKKAYIVILNYKTWEDTIECIESVLKSNYKNYQIIIVDNASSNDSLKKIQMWLDGKLDYIINTHEELKHYVFPLEKKPLKYIVMNETDITNKNIDDKEIILIQANKNNGFAAGNNIGIKFAMLQNDFKYIWLLNNDTVVEKDALTHLINCQNNQDIKSGIVGSKLLFYYKPDTIQATGGKFNKYSAYFSEINKNMKVINITSSECDIDYAIGASMLVSKEFIEQVGLLCESFFLYYEEIDWSIRGNKKNFMTRACPLSVVYHKEGGTTHIKNKKNLKIEYYKYINLIVLYKRFYRYLMPIAYFRLMMKMSKKLWQGKRDEAKLILKVILGLKNEV